MIQLLPYIDGKFIKTEKVLSVLNPYDQQKIGETFFCGEEEIEIAIASAQKALTEYQKWSLDDKSRVLKQIASTIENRKNEFAEVLCLESAKPIKYALLEIERAIRTFEIAGEEVYFFKSENQHYSFKNKNAKGELNYFPIGIVAGISPFNFPLNLAVHKIAPAIASACPIILKPASSTPLSTLLFAQVINEVNLPQGAVSIVPANRIAGNKLVTDNRIKLLSFTGSDEVGWEMKKNAGKKKVVLELGGNAATIVSEDIVDLSQIVEQCSIGAWAYSGQICIHSQRFFVHEKHFNKFLEMMKVKAELLIQGDPVNENTDFSVMIDESNAIRVEEWINEAIQQGARLVSGGTRNGSLVQPTILTNTNPAMKVVSEEVFGPVITIEKYKSIEEAIKHVNDSKFGLQASLFSLNEQEIEICYKKIETGSLVINAATTTRFDDMPYGGIKDSGLGREGVRYAMMDMLEPKLKLISS